MSHMSASVPKTVYKTPNPEEQVSELYTVYAEELPESKDPQKRRVVKERYGAWDEAEPDPKRKLKIKVFTLSPTDRSIVSPSKRHTNKSR
jgi:hypothetical protein